MATKIIRLDEIRFDEDGADVAVIEKHIPAFRDYRNQLKEYNLAKRAGRKLPLPEFPFNTVRVYEIDRAYLPIDRNVSAILLAAEKTKINLVKVIVQDVVVALHEFSLDKPPIHANRFFADYQRSMRQLQGTDSQRIKLFQSLLRSMLVEGFIDKSCRAEFMDWMGKEFERYPPTSSTTTGPAPKTRAELPPIQAGAFFDDFPSALERLQATDCQRVELFKPLLRMILNDGFTDKSYRSRFLFWAKREFDRISSDG